mgnify:CR=1 FL=1
MTLKKTPRPMIEQVVRSVCGSAPGELVSLSGGGMNETYRAQIAGNTPIVIRIAHQRWQWFTNEARAMALARDVGVPAPNVLGVEHVEHEGQQRSFSVLELVPGRALSELVGELPSADVERLVVESGVLLARLHSVFSDQETRHELKPLGEDLVTRVLRNVDQSLGAQAVTVTQRGVDLYRHTLQTRVDPKPRLTHGDWLPKHFLVGKGGTITSVIDWEFAGSAPPAFDLAHWEVAAGKLRHRFDLLRRGYAQITDPDGADEGWGPAFVIHFALDVLGWKNPASRAYQKRVVDAMARHVGA